MRNSSLNELKVNRCAYAVSMALAAFVAANPALAQETRPAAKSDEEVAQVLIVGTRASQQSAIDRKKNAATAMDSIIAEDVGAFPDRNVGEAISRIAGIALSRGDFGEGMSVSVRGNGPDLTRVEIDGQGVQAGGGTDLGVSSDSRGIEFREMSSDLIKSVDVVKGSTADMTEGALGGGIIIKTRTGLDFKKPYYSVRIGATQGSLGKKTTPNLNLVLSNKFLDNRLGVLLNVTKSSTNSESHSLANGGSNGFVGMLRLADLDNSPEKTFSFNPAAVADTDAARAPFLASPLTAGGVYNSASPLELVSKSGAAQSKADCNTAFPALSATQLAAINSSTARTSAINQRSNELRTCINQWHDYTPSLIRSYVRGQDDHRRAADLRFDFKVNSKLSVYAKIADNKRDVTDVVGNISLGQVTFNDTDVDNPTYRGPSFTETNGVRTAVPGSGYMTLPTTLFGRSGAMPGTGAVVNLKPGYTVDASHHLSSYTITDASMGTDIVFSNIKTGSRYLTAGGSYRDGGLKIEFLLGDAKSDILRMDRRGSISYGYGDASFAIQPDGSWGHSAPGNNPQLNFAAYSRLNPQVATTAVVPSPTNFNSQPAYSAAQRPLVTRNISLNVIRALTSESEERTAKADLSYAFSERVPLFNNIKTGFNLRESARTSRTAGTGGTVVKAPTGTFNTANFVPGVYLPTVLQTDTVSGCENTATSVAPGGQPCNYGYAGSKTYSTAHNGTTVLTQAGFTEYLAQAMSVAPNGQFFAGAKDRAPGLIEGWYQLDIDKMYKAAGIKTHLDCIVQCVASDGNVYAQPLTGAREKTTSGYLMTDFAIDRLPFSNRPLPFGIEFNGNFGYRMVRNQVQASGIVQFNSVRKNDNFDPLNPTAAAGVTTFTVRKNTTLERTTTDILPVFNLASWVIADKLVVRYNRAKTVARPPINRLIPNANCTYDERTLDLPDVGEEDEADQRCNNTIGNPALKAFTNINHNLSAEWYPNKDTMFSVSTFRQKGIIGGAARPVPRTNQKLFEGSNALDPVTNTPLADVEFAYNTWENQETSTRTGVELSSKTAFTFLPSVLRYTGFDANYTRQKSDQGVAMLDLISGDLLPVRGEPKYSYNASLWYDDGRFSARVALQVVAPIYNRFSPDSVNSSGINNFPAVGVSSVNLPYNPGAPNFTDMTRYLDAKVGYKFANGIELFLEGRNLGLSRRTFNTGGYQNFSGGIPSVYDDRYAGRRIMAGINIRSKQ